MKTKYLIFISITLALFSLATVITLIFNTAPTTLETIIIFYISLFISTATLMFLSLYSYFYFKSRLTLPWQITLTIIRYSILISVGIITLLILSSFNMLTVASLIALLMIIVIIELIWRRQSQKLI